MWPITMNTSRMFNQIFSGDNKKSHQSHRDFSMRAPTSEIDINIVAGKSFDNPNFVNNLNMYTNNSNQPGRIETVNLKNFCQKHLIDSIKEQCPKVIPSGTEAQKFEKDTDTCGMCLADKKSDLEYSDDHNTDHSMLEIVPQELSHNCSPQDIANIRNNCEFRMAEPQDIKGLLTGSNCSDSYVQTTTNFKTPSPKTRLRQYSTTDSEDSFIVFDDDNASVDSEDEQESKRKLSICDSEDSFITFEKDDFEIESIHDDTSDDISEEDEEIEENQTDVDEVDFTVVSTKKVRFAPGDKLCRIYPMIKWSFAYQAARKGPWEMYVRDSGRFKDRIIGVEKNIKYIFDADHRAKIYQERFVDL